MSTGGEETDIDEYDRVCIAFSLESSPESLIFYEIIEKKINPPVHQSQTFTPSLSHSPGHDISSPLEISPGSSKNSSRSAHSADKSVYRTTTIETDEASESNNKPHENEDLGDSNNTTVHQNHHIDHEDRHHNEDGQVYQSDAEGGDCYSCRCHPLPPVCTVIPDTPPSVRTTTTFAEESETLRSCIEICQTSTCDCVNSYELEVSDNTISHKDHELHEDNGHKRSHDGQDYQDHPQHNLHEQHGCEHHRVHSPHHPSKEIKKATHAHRLLSNDLAPSVCNENDISWFCCGTGSTPQSGSKYWGSFSWKSCKSKTKTHISRSSESKVRKATVKANSCFGSSTKSSSLFSRSKVPKMSTQPSISKKDVTCGCQAQMTTNNTTDQKEEHEKPPNDGCGCTSVQNISAGKTDQNVKYPKSISATKITTFEKYTTFDDLKSTKRKWKSLPCVLEDVLVAINDEE